MRKSTTPVGLTKRARAILMLASGKTFSKTSEYVGIRERHIRKWARRFVKQGIEGLNDAKRHMGIPTIRGCKPIAYLDSVHGFERAVR